ncbi:unnamed protein product [Sphagnum jensenii]|uniref:Amino acid transporter transmembrane domain-containing protein n=1 Tax=Sphagnum jensenii TaxID=128206 RepID=A0ABP0WZQ2_9BRYO
MADLESDGLSSGTGVHTILHGHDYSEKGTAGNGSNNGITSGVVDESLGKGGHDAWAPRNGHHRGTNDGTGFVGLFKKTIWHGGSVYDAWLNATAAQVGQVILTMPTSYAQMGYTWAVIFHIFYIATGIYTCYLLTRLYIEYRVRKEKEGVDFKKHIIQYHEVLGSLVGMWAQRVSLFFNIITVGAISVVQIIACASDAYYLNPHLPKRTWTAVFGAMSMVVVMLPTMHNFRIWSLIGILTTTYTAWYLFGASISNGQVPGVKHTAPINLETFFVGSTNLLFASGGHAITIEIMHAMWRPVRYKYVYVFTCLYVWSITIPHCLAVYWAFGDELLKKNNAFAVVPSSNFRSAAIVMMIVHQAVAFGLYSMPLYFMWEKLLRVHQSRWIIRTVSRLPVAIFLWFLAFAFPFFGPFNSLIGALIVSISTFIIPSVAYIIVFWTPIARQNEAEKPGILRRFVGFRGMLGVNFFVIVVIVATGTALGSWANIKNIISQIKTFGVFEKCYQC